MERKQPTRTRNGTLSKRRNAKRKPGAVHFFKTGDTKGFRIPASLRKIGLITAKYRQLKDYDVSKDDLINYAHILSIMRHWIKFPLIRKNDYKTALTIAIHLKKILQSQFEIMHVDYADKCIHFSHPIESPECGFMPIKYATRGSAEDIRFNMAIVHALGEIGYRSTRNEFFSYHDEMYEQMNDEDSKRPNGHYDRNYRQREEEKTLAIINYAERVAQVGDLLIFKHTDPVRYAYGLLLYILLETGFHMPEFAVPFLEGESEVGIGYYDVHCLCYNYSIRFHKFFNHVIDSVYQSMGSLDQLRWRASLTKQNLSIHAYPFLYEILDTIPDYNFQTGTFFGKDKASVTVDEERCIKLTIRLDGLFCGGKYTRGSSISELEWINKGEETTADKTLTEAYQFYENFVTTTKGMVAKGTGLYESTGQDSELTVEESGGFTTDDIHELDEED